MPVSITSRELFKSYGKALDVPVILAYQYTTSKPYKNWKDIFLEFNPTFIGTIQISSLQGKTVNVTYAQKFVIYPYFLYHQDGKPIVTQQIISREEALLFNIPRGDEIVDPTINNTLLPFDGFPLDRPLAENEFIGRSTASSPEEIITKKSKLGKK